MGILASAPAGDNSGPGSCALRADPLDPQPIPTGDPVGYGFDPIPSAIRRDPRLKAIDHHVLAILISFAVWRRDSCWTTMKIIAVRLPAIRPGRSGKAVACERTAQRSIDRLKAAGYIRHERVAKPDPDQPGNWTGWRFFFNFAPIQVAPIDPRREVTKGPGEVTKESPGIATPGGEVTKESGDFLVTQARGDVRELEPITLDAIAFASRGGESPTMPADPVATVEAPPAPMTPDRLRIVAAYQLGRAIFAQGRDLRARVGADWSIEWTIGPGGGPLPTPAELAEIERLKPEFLDELRSRPGFKVPPRPSSPTPPENGGSSPVARKVPPGVRKDIRTRIGGLRLPETTDRDVEEAARALVAALAPHRDHGRTVATFARMCRRVRRGEMPEAVVQDAFEAACGRKVESRGALFVALVKDSAAKPKGPGRPPAAESP